MGLMAVAATVSKDRIQPVGRLFIGLISFRSAGGIAGPGSILRPGRREANSGQITEPAQVRCPRSGRSAEPLGLP